MPMCIIIYTTHLLSHVGTHIHSFTHIKYLQRSSRWMELREICQTLLPYIITVTVLYWLTDSVMFFYTVWMRGCIPAFKCVVCAGCGSAGPQRFWHGVRLQGMTLTFHPEPTTVSDRSMCRIRLWLSVPPLIHRLSAPLSFNKVCEKLYPAPNINLIKSKFNTLKLHLCHSKHMNLVQLRCSMIENAWAIKQMHLGIVGKQFISYSGLTCHFTGRFSLPFLQLTFFYLHKLCQRQTWCGLHYR